MKRQGDGFSLPKSFEGDARPGDGDNQDVETRWHAEDSEVPLPLAYGGTVLRIFPDLRGE